MIHCLTVSLSSADRRNISSFFLKKNQYPRLWREPAPPNSLPEERVCYSLQARLLLRQCFSCSLWRNFQFTKMDVCEFLAEDELIEIVPTFRYDQQLNLITGDFGPFRPSVPVKVPMWLAINLRRQNKCSIISPNWVNSLPRIQEQQENETGKLLPPPNEHWKEILKLLEQEFGRSIQCSDLLERREAILKKSVHELFNEARDKNSLFIGDITLDNVTPAELILVKQLIASGFKRLQELRRTLLIASSRKHY